MTEKKRVSVSPRAESVYPEPWSMNMAAYQGAATARKTSEPANGLHSLSTSRQRLVSQR